MHIDEHVIVETGSRITRKSYLELTKLSNNFKGLPEGVGRYDLLLLIKRVGRNLGFSTSLISHLEYLINHTRDSDWLDGGRPIVYKTVQKTALELGVSERQISNRENALHKIKALVWSDFGNFRRTGVRDRRGNILFAYGVNLAPLAALYDKLSQLEAEQLAYEEAWIQARRQHSSLKRYVSAQISQLEGLEVNSAMVSDIWMRFDAFGRVRVSMPLKKLKGTTDQLVLLKDELSLLIKDVDLIQDNDDLNLKTSAWAEGNFRPNYYTNKDDTSEEDCNQLISKRTDARTSGIEECSNFAGAQRSGSPGEPVCRSGQVQSLKDIITPKINIRDLPDTGVQHISIGNVLAAASGEFKLYIPNPVEATWSDIVEAAEYLRHDLDISRPAWVDACAVMGRNAAAIAVLIIDRNRSHPDHPVLNPGGVLRGMVLRADDDELHLHRSLFGILHRDSLGGVAK